MLFTELISRTREEDKCLIYLGLLDNSGYGRITVKGKRWKAHRYSFFLAKGEIPKGFYICHSCDKPACINPDHLFLGTQDDNMKDALKKDRIKRGEFHGKARLTQADVDYIRSCFDKNGKAPYGTMTKLARQFNVSKVTINFIKRGLSWKNDSNSTRVGG